MPRKQGPRVTRCSLRKAPSTQRATGGLKLPQYRQQLILDMTGCFTRTESTDEYLDEFLPFRSNLPHLKLPVYEDNPFSTLEHAETMPEAKVAELFVSLLS